jgi:hypothetical protein
LPPGAGCEITLNPVEFATALKLQDAGQSEAFLIGWSGRIDPDGNIYNFHSCSASQNVTSVCDTATDDVLKQIHAVTDSAQRAELYAQVIEMQAPLERLAARRSATQSTLDMQLKIAYVEASGVPWGEDLG